MGQTFAELIETAVGPISFVGGDAGLQQVSFSTLADLKRDEDLNVKAPSLVGLETVGTLMAEMNAFLFGLRKTFSINIDWSGLKGFQREVLTLAVTIPYGMLMTYGEMAAHLGKPGAARAVGQALANNPMPIVIPCHRVVSSEKRLHGYIGGLERKAYLLRLEGHLVEWNRVLSR